MSIKQWLSIILLASSRVLRWIQRVKFRGPQFIWHTSSVISLSRNESARSRNEFLTTFMLPVTVWRFFVLFFVLGFLHIFRAHAWGYVGVWKSNIYPYFIFALLKYSYEFFPMRYLIWTKCLMSGKCVHTEFWSFSTAFCFLLVVFFLLPCRYLNARSFAGVTIESDGTRALVLRWSVPDCRGSPITQYLLRVETKSEVTQLISFVYLKNL